jgi:integrase
MAWAEKLPSGKYRGLYRDARNRRRSAGTFTHKAEAKREAAAAEAKARRLEWRDPAASKKTWGAWCESWWPSRDVEKATLATDKGRRDTHVMPKWRDWPLGAITRHEVKVWRGEMRDAGVSNSTINRAVALLSVSLTAAVDAEVIEINPLTGMKKLPEPPPKHQRLSPEGYDALLEQLPTPRDQLIVKMLASTGLRWGELAGLHRARVNFETGMLTVAETFSERVGVMMPYPKGKRLRVVPVPDWLLETLRDLPHEGQTCGLEHSVGTCPGPLLVTTKRGSVLRNTNWAPVWRKAVEDAGVGPLRIHDLRGSVASWWLTGGNDLAEVRDLLGHRDARTTDRYAGLDGVNSARVTAAVPRPRGA